MAAKRKKTARKTRTASRSGSSTPTLSAPAAGGLTASVPSGSIMRGEMPPAGLFSTSLADGADVSDQMAELAPTFGDVLLSVGTGVAESQDALDRGLVETAKALSDTKITIVTDVVQSLNDDGLPVVEDTDLRFSEVSVINYVNPTVHEWSHVALSMDLSVGAMDNERGATFSQKQSGGRSGGVGYLWGFVGWFSTSSYERSYGYESNASQETDWASGQVRLDAQLQPRDIERFPAPAEVSIGPQMYFSLGSVTETTSGDVVTARSVDVEIFVRKADGSENPSVGISLDSGPFRQSFKTDEGYNGTMTNADGRCRVTLTRDIPNIRFLRATTAEITAELGEVRKVTEVTL